MMKIIQSDHLQTGVQFKRPKGAALIELSAEEHESKLWGNHPPKDKEL